MRWGTVALAGNARGKRENVYTCNRLKLTMHCVGGEVTGEM